MCIAACDGEVKSWRRVKFNTQKTIYAFTLAGHIVSTGIGLPFHYTFGAVSITIPGLILVFSTSTMEILMIEQEVFETQVEHHYRHNFRVSFLDLALFLCGASFIARNTILPLYVSHFTDNTLLIGLIPALASGGWLLPQIFTANWVQRLPVKKVVPVKLGLFAERLPLILLALSTWLVSSNNPRLALVLFFIFFTWHAFGAGVAAVAWQDMIAKIIPQDRRGRFMGVTRFAGTATGVLGFLSNYEFPKGYAMSFSVGTGFILLSWVALSLTREPPQVNHSPSITQLEYLRKLPAIIREDKNFMRFLISQMVWAVGMMANGFIAVYAVERWSLPDSYAGNFTTATLIGQALSYLFFGSMADRKGHKLVLELSALVGAVGIGLTVFASSPTWIYAVFLLTGFSIAGLILSGLMIAIEFCGPELRPTYIGLNNTTFGIVAVFSPIIGGWMAGEFGYQALFGASFLVGLLTFAMTRWWVREPRVDKEISDPVHTHV
jgi:MFS family permease